MAKKLGVSSAFLSQIENGGKKPPKNWEEDFLAKYDLDEVQEREFRECVFEATNSKSIDLSSYSQSDRDMMLSFARKLSTINDEQKELLRNIISKN
jgi:transcriptional regulator with XRE-family HTH domain